MTGPLLQLELVALVAIGEELNHAIARDHEVAAIFPFLCGRRGSRGSSALHHRIACSTMILRRPQSDL
jgi:hypothetical protein